MAPQTSVTLDGMTKAQTNFENALSDLNTVSNDMNEQQATLAANWSGESSSQFGLALTVWLDDLGTVKIWLIKVIDQLQQHTHVYGNTHATNTEVATAFLNQQHAGTQGLAGLRPNAG